MKEIVERGATAVVLHLFLPDASSSQGAGRTGVGPATNGLVVALIRPGDAGPVAYTSATGTIEPISALGTWVAPTEGRCRWRELEATLLPGWYELQLPNTWFDTTGDRRSVAGMVWGPAGVVPTPFQIQLSDPLRGVGSPTRLDAAVSTRADAAAYTPARAGRLDLLDVAVSTRGDATAANQTTLLNRLGPFTGGSLNSVFGFLRGALRKDAGLTPSDLQGAFDNTTDSLEARADMAAVQQGEVLNRLGPFSGGALNSVFGFLRGALRKDAGLTPSDLQGAFDNTTDSLEARADIAAVQQGEVLNRLGPFSGGALNSVFGFLRGALRKDAGLTPPDLQGAFDNTTDSLEAQSGQGGEVGLSAAERAAIAAAVLDLVDGVEPGETPRQTLRLLRAVCVGKSTGFPDGPVAFRDRADSKNRVVATVDGQGNRQTVATDGT
jgi:hypothetical protein